jgi:hypothetical protein
MWNINEVIDAAKALGITLTNANEGTDLYQCWADRVMDAMNAFKRNDIPRSQEIIEDANSYAV